MSHLLLRMTLLTVLMCSAPLLIGCGQSPGPAVDKTDSKQPSETQPRTAEDGKPDVGSATDNSNTVQLASFKAPSTEATWSSFRGPTGMGVSEAKGLPVNWSLTENIAWKAELPGPGASSPIVFGDRIYITAYSGFFVPGKEGSKEDLTRHLVALKRTDGSLIWEQKVKAKLPEEDRIRDHGFAASTAAADAAGVIVFFGKTGVIAFNHEGNEVWRQDVGSKTHGWGSSASPVLYKDLVFINASVESGSLVALDRKTGDVKWQQKGINDSWNTPVLVKSQSGSLELVVAIQGKILAFNPDTGEPLWNCKTDIGWYMVPSVVAGDGVVLCLGGRSGKAGLAVRTGGSGDVTETHRLWTSTKGCNVPSPIYLDKHLYWMHQDLGVAYCAKAETGEIVYEERLARGQVYASALLADGKIYYLTRDGKTYVVAAKPQFEEIAVSDLSDRNDRNNLFNGSPAVDGSRLLIRNDKYLYCIGK
jgi:outer membrane protein assembly factor BamB